MKQRLVNIEHCESALVQWMCAFGLTLDWLNNAYQMRHPYFPWCGEDGDFASLRDQPRFQELTISFLRRHNWMIESICHDPRDIELLGKVGILAP